MTIQPQQKQSLMQQAKQAATKAYAPYSKFFVGAALLTADGKVFLGANVENASYGGTICAERTAFLKAIFEGYRKFTAIAVWGGRDGKPCVPCGICLQFMAEFCEGDFMILLFSEDGEVKEFTLNQLLPMAFGK